VVLGLKAEAGGYENCGPGDSARSRCEVLGECVGSENASCVELRVRVRFDLLPTLGADWPPKNEEIEDKNDMETSVLCAMNQTFSTAGWWPLTRVGNIYDGSSESTHDKDKILAPMHYCIAHLVHAKHELN
jgi:hypothetical protein